MKDTRVNIRLPQAEKEEWEAIAHQYGLTTTEFVTRSVRGTIQALRSTSNTTSGNAAFGAAPTVSFASWTVSTSGGDSTAQ